MGTKGRRRRGKDSGAAFIVPWIFNHPANRHRRLRKLSEALAFQLRGRLFGTPTVARVGEHSYLWAHMDMSCSKRALYANPPDWPEMWVWREQLGPGNLFVDVGANVGLYTLWAIEQGAEVVAIEPVERAIRCLRANLALNGYEATTIQAAVADQPGTVTMEIDRGVANRLVLEIGRGKGRVQEVPAVTLDDVIGDRVVAGCKIDVEGAESLVLKGAERALAEHRIKLLQLEWNGRSRALLGEERSVARLLLESAGYEILRPQGDGSLIAVDSPAEGADVFARPRA